MLQDLFENAKHELRGALSKRHHPFKYVTLSTVDEYHRPQSRTVVLREMDNNLNAVIFTDSRTAKVAQLLLNQSACILAYHPKKLLQVKLNGTLKLITDHSETKRLFQKVSEKAIKDYTTTSAPGSSIDNPDHVEYQKRKDHHFMPLQFVPEQVEILQLKRPNHLRALFKKENDWSGEWLVP